MLLGYALTPFGHDPNAWRQRPGDRQPGFPALLDQVVAAEEGGFDFVLLADRHGARPAEELSPLAVPFEPTLLASALVTRAGRIGFVAAASTARQEPYNLARRFASLDLISAGRSGWLVVPGDERTGRDSEYVDVVTALWDSFEDDAFIYDKAAGRFFDPSKMHVAQHGGVHFSVRGPLNVNPSPQGRPVTAHLIKAGEDDALAIRTGDLLLLQAGSTEELIEMARQIASSLGPRREAVRLLANIVPIVTQNGTAIEQAFAGEHLTGLQIGGTPDAIAERLQELAMTARLDGVTILPPTLDMAQRFFDDVLPVLARCGAIGTSRHGTLRDRLGLARPVHPASSKAKGSP